MADPPPLSAHLAWLASVSGKPCACRYQYLPSGLTGHGWVRVATAPRCPAHGTVRRG